MDKDEKMTSRHYGSMQKGNEEDKARVSDAEKSFNRLEEFDKFGIFNKLTWEPFSQEILHKILTTDFSGSSELLANSLIAFYEAMEEIFWIISESIGDWDTPAGKPSPEYCYGVLLPTLKELDGIFYLDSGYTFYDSVLEKLSDSLKEKSFLE